MSIIENMTSLIGTSNGQFDYDFITRACLLVLYNWAVVKMLLMFLNMFMKRREKND
jgi:hypothetical protein